MNTSVYGGCSHGNKSNKLSILRYSVTFCLLSFWLYPLFTENYDPDSVKKNVKFKKLLTQKFAKYGLGVTQMPKGIFLYGKDDLAGLKWVRTRDKSIFSHNNHMSETPDSIPQSQGSDNPKVTIWKQFLLLLFLSLIEAYFKWCRF